MLIDSFFSSQVLECSVATCKRSDNRLCTRFVRERQHAVSEQFDRNSRSSQFSPLIVTLDKRLTIAQQTYISGYLHELLDWLNNWPGGVKLNTELSTLICDSFLFLSRLWQGCASISLLYIELPL